MWIICKVWKKRTHRSSSKFSFLDILIENVGTFRVKYCQSTIINTIYFDGNILPNYKNSQLSAIKCFVHFLAMRKNCNKSESKYFLCLKMFSCFLIKFSFSQKNLPTWAIFCLHEICSRQWKMMIENYPSSSERREKIFSAKAIWYYHLKCILFDTKNCKVQSHVCKPLPFSFYFSSLSVEFCFVFRINNKSFLFLRENIFSSLFLGEYKKWSSYHFLVRLKTKFKTQTKLVQWQFNCKRKR